MLLKRLAPLPLALFLGAAAASAAPSTAARPAAPVASPPAPSAHSPLDAIVDQAQRTAAAGDVAGAVKLLEPYAKDPQLSAPGKATLGYLYVESNRPAEALTLLEPLANNSSADAAVLYNAARAAFGVHQNDKGMKWLSRSVSLDANSPAGRMLGMILAREGKVVEAYQLLLFWLKENPRDGDARVEAAALALVLERPEEAQGLLRGLDAANPAIQVLQAKVYLQTNHPQQALALLEPLLKNHPPQADLELRRMTASAYIALNRPKDAIALLQGKTGNEPTALVTLARAQHQAGDQAGALATLAPIATNLPAPEAVGDPRPPTAVALEYGSLLMAAGRPAEAVPVLQQATKLSPWSETAWRQLAAALQATGKKDESQKALEQAQKIAQAAKQKAPPGAH
jgi:predicted Zn-dependent protease